MEEKENKEVNDWGGAEKWLAELIENARANAKRWFVAWLITLAALIATNVYWIYAMNSYEYVYQDGSGQNNYNNNVDGDVNNVTTDKEEEKWKE